MSEKKDSKTKRTYVKPAVQKHEASTLVSGSKKKKCVYRHKTAVNTYYH